MSVKSDNKVKRRSINREKQMLDSRELLRCSSIRCIAGIGWDAEKIQGRVRVKAATDGYTDSTGDAELSLSAKYELAHGRRPILRWNAV
jgi:hypothetical protein